MITPARSPAAEAASLEGMDLQALRALWRDRYGDPPRLRSAGLLRRMLAWRIQIEAEPALGVKLAEALGERAAGARELPMGLVVAREWKGVRHQAEVTADGVLYQGRRHDSLSSVAREITGVRWNGPRFFGLRPGRGR